MKKTKEKIISLIPNLRGGSTESFLAIWLSQYKFLIKEFLAKKCVMLKIFNLLIVVIHKRDDGCCSNFAWIMDKLNACFVLSRICFALGLFILVLGVSAIILETAVTTSKIGMY